VSAIVALHRVALATDWVAVDNTHPPIVIISENTVIGTVDDPLGLLNDGQANDVAVDVPGNRAYAGGELFPSGVVVIDLASRSAVAGLSDPLHLTDAAGGYSQVWSLALNPDRTRLYFTATFGAVGGCIVADTASDTIVDAWQLPAPAKNAIVSPDGLTLYVTTAGAQPNYPNQPLPDFSLLAIDPATHAILRSTVLGAANGYDSDEGGSAKLRLSADGATLYVVASDRLFAVDTATFSATTVNDPDGLLPHPHGIAVAGTKLFVEGEGAPPTPRCGDQFYRGNVAVIDAASFTAYASIPLQAASTPGIGANLDGSIVYAPGVVDADPVACYPEPKSKVTIIDTGSDSAIGTVADPDQISVYIKTAVDPYSPVPPTLCGDTPALSCNHTTASLKSKLTLKTTALASSRKLTWSLPGLADTTLAAFGHPDLKDTYALCVYDMSGPTPTRLFAAATTDFPKCGKTGASCWKLVPGVSWQYADGAASHDGLSKIQLKAGTGGKASITVTAKGAALPLPSLAAWPTPLLVQLQSRDCWEGTFSPAGTAHDAGGVFVGKGN
jgi:hypothetical protein